MQDNFVRTLAWTWPWHTILHECGGPVLEQMELNACAIWSDSCMIEYSKLAKKNWHCWKTLVGFAVPWRGILKVAGVFDGRGDFFDVGDGPSNKPCRQLGDWKEAQDTNVQYTDDFITSMFLYRTRTIRLDFTPNGLPHGPKSKSKSSAKRKSTKLCKHHRKQGPRSSTCNLQSCSAHCNSERTWAFSHTRTLSHIGNRLLPSLYLAVPVSNEDGDRHEMFRNTWAA